MQSNFTAKGQVNINLKKSLDLGHSHQIHFSIIDTGKGIAKNAVKNNF